MLHQYLQQGGRDYFMEALGRYLQDRQYKNANAQQLWAHFEAPGGGWVALRCRWGLRQLAKSSEI